MEMKFAEQEIKYTGKELAPHFAYKNFKLQGDSIVAFIGEAEVKITEMVDIEDVLEDAPIYSESMLHFIVEHFNICLTEGVSKQRLLIAITKDIVSKHIDKSHKVERRGDDIFVDDKKLSVSIATKSLTSVLMHFAMNISSKNTPIETAGLSTELGIRDIKKLAIEIMLNYIEEIDGINKASVKVRGVY